LWRLTADGAIRSDAHGVAPTLFDINEPISACCRRLTRLVRAISVFFGLLFGREDCFSSPRFDGFRVLRMTPLAAGVALPPLASDAIFKSPSFYASS
jgi:hypothetical protein